MGKEFNAGGVILGMIDVALDDISLMCLGAKGETSEIIEESLEAICAKIETIEGLLGEYYESKQ